MTNKVKELPIINEDTKVEDVIKILEEQEIDSLTMEEGRTFSASMTRYFSLEDLKEADKKRKTDSSSRTIAEVICFDEKFNLNNSDFVEDMSCGYLNDEDGYMDFSDTNNSIKNKNMTTIIIGVDLLKFATDTLPETIDVKVGEDLVSIYTDFKGLYDSSSTVDCGLSGKKVATIIKEDVLKTISSDLDKWTDRIQEWSIKCSRNGGMSLEYLMREVLESTKGYPSVNDVRVEDSLNNFTFEPQFEINHDKYELRFVENFN